MRLLRCVSVLVVLALGGMASTAEGTASASVRTVKSAVTITSGEGTEFKGKVSSSVKQCRANRTVTLYMKAESARTADPVAGTDKTDASGNWTIDGTFVAAVYYARVAAVLVHVHGSPIRCAYDWTIPMRF